MRIAEYGIGERRMRIFLDYAIPEEEV